MRKKIFFKSTFTKKKISIIFFILIILCFIFIYFNNYNKIFFYIPANNAKFYDIPKDKGGKKIENQNKKGLHLSLENNEVLLDEILDINYSIQIFTSDDFNKINQYKSKILSYEDNIFESKDLFIAILNTELGYEYFLLYKNFENYSAASNHCNKYTKFIKKCVIVNVKNLE